MENFGFLIEYIEFFFPLESYLADFLLSRPDPYMDRPKSFDVAVFDGGEEKDCAFYCNQTKENQFKFVSACRSDDEYDNQSSTKWFFNVNQFNSSFQKMHFIMRFDCHHYASMYVT